MSVTSKNEKRETLTLNWRRSAASPAQGIAPDEYVEVSQERQLVLCSPKLVAGQRVNQEADPAFSRRMDNWRRTVRSVGGSGGDGSCCASWAALYVATHVAQRVSDDERRALQMPRSIVSVDQLDGWLMEGVVRCLADINERMALRFKYVWQYPDHWIKAKLGMRKSGLTELMARAESNVQLFLDRLENPTKILSNNLHAGKVPRLESTDALRGRR